MVLPVEAFGQSAVQRGTPVPHGAFWTQTYDWSADVRPGGKLILRADTGSLRITPGPAPRLECRVLLRAFASSEQRARRVFDTYRLSARPLPNGGVYLSGELPGWKQLGRAVGAQFDVKLPSRFDLQVETQGGDIDLAGSLQGSALLTTAGGDIHTLNISGPSKIDTAVGGVSLGNLGGRTEIRTAGGSIHVGNVRGDAAIETGGGDIEVGQVGGTLRAETPGGDVLVAGATGPVIAQTAGGQIQVGPTGGTVRAETAAGSIRLRGASGAIVAETEGGSIDLLQLRSAVRASTSAGRILVEFDANAKNFASSMLETSLGDVYVYLPPGLPLTIDAAIAAAAGHHIVTDFPLSILGDQENFALSSIRGQGPLNGGGQVLRIRTRAGNIEIRKLDSYRVEELKSKSQNP